MLMSSQLNLLHGTTMENRQEIKYQLPVNNTVVISVLCKLAFYLANLALIIYQTCCQKCLASEISKKNLQTLLTTN